MSDTRDGLQVGHDELRAAAQRVLDTWASGDLAGAVTDLGFVLAELAEG